jgi:hypothetical protein
VREIDDPSATVWWGVQVRQLVCTLAQCSARVQESCAGRHSQCSEAEPIKQVLVIWRKVSVMSRPFWNFLR